jgi:large subunit ribosomal protein L23
MNEPHEIIKTASLTEKSTLMSEKLNKYVFRVSPRASKIQIKNAVERLFQKKVVAVNTCNYAGKKKRVRGPLGRRSMLPAAAVCKPAGRTGCKPMFQQSYGTKRLSPAYADFALQVAAALR